MSEYVEPQNKTECPATCLCCKYYYEEEACTRELCGGGNNFEYYKLGLMGNIDPNEDCCSSHRCGDTCTDKPSEGKRLDWRYV